MNPVITLMHSALIVEWNRHIQNLDNIQYAFGDSQIDAVALGEKTDEEIKRHGMAVSEIEGGAEDAEVARKGK
jgi:hypothetical protein